MIRLAHRVTVERVAYPSDRLVWAWRCHGCTWWLPYRKWSDAWTGAQLHATNCPDLRRLNRPVLIGSGL